MRTPSLHKELGLTDDEMSMIVGLLGREPSDVELAMYAVMWSEHCSYKSSRVHLSRLPTEGSRVLVGPGENAGVVDVGDGLAVALRIESHNHPSAIEPYQGAATGVGGILRDIFTMGARPIALMDPLFIGPPEDARSRYILDGVVRGIAGYGNAVGVPTVGGQLTLSPAYKGNPLVNVFCLGILRADRVVLSAASGPGNLAVLLGSRTGRDGIGGVSVLASAGFGAGEDGAGEDEAGEDEAGEDEAGEDEAGEDEAGEDDETAVGNGRAAGSADAGKRPSVQVGDPFEEKRLIEACLTLMERRLVVAVQDLGGAGLSCAASEAAARAGLGMDLDITAVRRREPGMSSVEVMTSESQERMLAIVEPSRLAEVEEVCAHFEVEATVVGTVRAPDADGIGRLRVREGHDGPVVAELPAASLSDAAPRYRRPMAAPTSSRTGADPDLLADGAGEDCAADLLALLLDPEWVYRQYDHQLYCNTVLGPGEGDATVLRLAAPGFAATGKGLALSTDANPGWCRLEPRRGTAATVAESVLNVACAGARAIALVNCLNFGNPEHPEVMWQLSEAIDGMAEACLALGVPVVGGNVSLYNEHSGADIDPTPVVAVLGLIEDLAARPPAIGLSTGDELLLLGRTEARLGGSRWAELHGAPGGELFALDLAAHGALVELVRDLVAGETLRRASSSELMASRAGPGALAGHQARPCNPEDRRGPEASDRGPEGSTPGTGGRRLVSGLHDVSGGGLAVTLAELARGGGCGVVVRGVGSPAELFAESPSRVVVATTDADAVIGRAELAGVPARRIGVVEGERVVVEGLCDVSLGEIERASRARLSTLDSTVDAPRP